MAESSKFSANTEIRFRSPKSLEQESKLLQESIPKSTAYKTKWAIQIFNEWQINRNVKVSVFDAGGAFKDCGDLSNMGANATGRVNLSRRLRIVKGRCIQKRPIMELSVASEGI